MVWNLYKDEKFLEPLRFSNGKTQKEVIQEVLNLIKQGEKIIFIHGICGTGKSAIALNLAKELGKTSIVVPGKNLQNQYKRDYEKDKYLLKHNKEKLKISIITGRKNHKCKFLEDSSGFVPKFKKEINLKLHDIFEGKREEHKEFVSDDVSANNKNLPCKIEIRERNWDRIKKYIRQNPKINFKNFDSIKDVRRLSIAPVCPYWSPVLPEKYEIKNLDSVEKKSYVGLNNVPYIFHKRKPGCSFYEQFDSYVNSDVLVFNSLKYLLESAMNRKPMTEIEIIDECDEFLDSFSNQRTINIDRLQNSLIQFSVEEDLGEGEFSEIFELIKYLKKDERIENASRTGNILSLKETGLYDLLKLFLKASWAENVDDESYVFEILETAHMFKEFLEETYIVVSKKENSFIFNLVTINLAKRLEELISKNKRVVLMSGTLHSENVLKSIFGLDNFKFVEAETKDQGSISVVRTGLEKDCKYSNFSSGKVDRKDYLLALDKCLKVAKRPVLVHVNSFKDLPNEDEIVNYDLNNLISRDDVKFLQSGDSEGKMLKEFKQGKKDVLFSTRDSRGVDFPGGECNSIVFTKYPNPDIQDAFWKILNKVKPSEYWSFYKDKARRELLQKIYRGLRFKEDHVAVLSPDSRVLNFFDASDVFVKI